MITIAQLQALVPDVAKLTDDQFVWIERLVRSMASPLASTRNPESNVFLNDREMGLFFLYLATHHVLSSEPFKKEKYEYAMESIMGDVGRIAARPGSRTHPGLDLTVDGVRWSLKSEAHRSIKKDFLHVSKWMELGRGRWGDSEEDLRMLCGRFLDHLDRYDRIFVLRCLTPEDPIDHHYEMVEIPKTILTMAGSGDFTMMQLSRQRPLPGYCRVSDGRGQMYELYFDGGTERKLRLQKLRRDLCIFHAEWRFQSPGRAPVDETEAPPAS